MTVLPVLELERGRNLRAFSFGSDPTADRPQLVFLYGPYWIAAPGSPLSTWYGMGLSVAQKRRKYWSSAVHWCSQSHSEGNYLYEDVLCRFIDGAVRRD